MSRLLALDFDGVLCDSRPECLITGLAAYSRMDHRVARPPRDFEAIDPELASQFMAHRLLVRVAAEFVLLFDLLLSDSLIQDKDSLENQTPADPNRLEQFRNLFYQERRRWQQEDPDSWFAHNAVFADVFNVAKIWHAMGKLVIVSAKDQDSILSILGRKGLDLPRELVLDTTKGDKPQHIQDLTRQHSDIFFVDDNLQNLLLARREQVTPVLAQWGFVSPYTLNAAEEKGIEVLNILQFMERFS